MTTDRRSRRRLEEETDHGLDATRFTETRAATLAGAATGLGLTLPVSAQEPKLDLKPEEGASLRVLRPAKFVAGDEKLWLENTEKYTKQTGVKVKVESQAWEDLRPKAAVAANVGKGPDIVYGWYDDAHQYPDKLVDLSISAAISIRNMRGGTTSAKFGMRDGKWIAIPLGAAGARIVYRTALEGSRLRCLAQGSRRHAEGDDGACRQGQARRAGARQCGG